MVEVPFYINTSDDSHCVQAVFKMALGHFMPNKQITWKQLDELSQKQPGKGTWWFPAVAKLNELGLKTKYIEQFDYQQYYQLGDDYLIEFYGQQAGEWFMANSNILSVKHLIPEFLATSATETRAPNLQDINNLLNKKWLVGVEVNVRVLQNRPGFNGHMILIYGHENNKYIAHDPGLPALPGRHINEDIFYKAWSYNGPSKTGLIAFKKA